MEVFGWTQYNGIVYAWNHWVSGVGFVMNIIVGSKNSFTVMCALNCVFYLSLVIFGFYQDMCSLFSSLTSAHVSWGWSSNTHIIFHIIMIILTLSCVISDSSYLFISSSFVFSSGEHCSISRENSFMFALLSVSLVSDFFLGFLFPYKDLYFIVFVFIIMWYLWHCYVR